MCVHQQQDRKLPFGCAGSRFIGFGGAEPPLLIALETFVAFRQCTFEDLDLSAEVFDVSFGGMLHLDDCTFQNVLLRQGRLVGTSLNDDAYRVTSGAEYEFIYFPEDDAAYDIPLEPLDPENPNAGMHVGNATLSDCLRHAYRCVSFHGSMHVCTREIGYALLLGPTINSTAGARLLLCSKVRTADSQQIPSRQRKYHQQSLADFFGCKLFIIVLALRVNQVL